MAQERLFVLEVACDAVLASVWVNGFDVFAEAKGEPRSMQMKLNPWLLDGANQLEVDLAPPPGGPASGAPEFQLRLVQGVLGTEPGPDGVLEAFSWDPSKEPREEKPRKVLNRRFVVRPAFGRWAWEVAERPTPEPEVIAQAIDTVEEIRRALEARDARRVGDLLSLKHREMARALSLSAFQIQTDLTRALEDMMQGPDWSIAPIEPAETSVAPRSERRLWRVRGRDGVAVVQARSRNRVFALDVVLARLDGRWTVVR